MACQQALHDGSAQGRSYNLPRPNTVVSGEAGIDGGKAVVFSIVLIRCSHVTDFDSKSPTATIYVSSIYIIWLQHADTPGTAVGNQSCTVSQVLHK